MLTPLAKFSCLTGLIMAAVLTTISLVSNKAVLLLLFIVDVNIIFWEFKNVLISLLGCLIF